MILKEKIKDTKQTSLRFFAQIQETKTRKKEEKRER
jgi:hypothetical protein